MGNMRIEAVPKMDNLIPLILESLANGRSVRFSPHGISMLPMLRQGTDSVVLSPIKGKLHKYDLPLYRRDDGKYVLHRIVEITETYTCIGDNQHTAEPGIRQDQLIAVVTAFYRGQRKHSTNSPIYRVYCRVWHYSRKPRYFLHKIVQKLRAIK